jgi:hypothetical protein
VLTGSVSRGVADDVSDIELLVVTHTPLELDDATRARCWLADGLRVLESCSGPSKR